MKNYTFRLLLLTFFLTSAYNYAQPSYVVIEKTIPYNHWATSFTIDVIGANEDFVMYHWQKFIEKHKGISYVTSAKEGNVEFESLHVNFPILNNEKVTLYSRFSPNDTESGVLLTIWIKLKDNTYYSAKTHKDSAKRIKDWLLGFNQRIMEENKY